GPGSKPAKPPRTARDPIDRRHAWLTEKFARYSTRMVRRRFHGVRYLTDGHARIAPQDVAVPSAVMLNHPSWWDPLSAVVASRAFFPNHVVFAPIDAAMLAAYPLLDRFGFFGVDQGSPRGAAQFLRTSGRILDDPRRMLWLTAQGRFADARTRPIGLMPGLAHLSRRVPGLRVYPLALEYPMWDQSKPELLMHLAPPIEPPGDASSTEAWSAALEAGLTRAMDRLADAAQARDPGRFTALNAGRSGVGGAYDAWRRLTSWARGKKFQADHG
ncbi:MAG: lysophospholipid acyltransferase family protein, partial [Planctomycetota bacterium]